MFINHLCECEVRAASMRIAKAEFSKTLMRPGGVHGKNEHNSENKFCSRNSCVISCNTPKYNSFRTCLGYNKSKSIFIRNKIKIK